MAIATKPDSIWHALQFDLHKATASLMYLLQGMESVRNSELPSFNRLWKEAHPGTPQNFPKPPAVDARLEFVGPAFDLNDLLQREGPVEQMAYKGWIEEVYFLWDHRYRKAMRDGLQASDAIAPRADAPGDLRLIRNDLIHKGGIASEESSGRCKVLRWFEPGEPIVLGMRHVFDFLNQMGFMTEMPGFLPGGISVGWSFLGLSDADLSRRPVPDLVSLRTEIIGEADDGSVQFVTSAVFENGIFIWIPVLRRPPAAEKPRLIEEFTTRTRIDERGNIAFPDGQIIAREPLYRDACQVLLAGGAPAPEGFAFVGPWFRIRE